jgi:hypothetical protein
MSMQPAQPGPLTPAEFTAVALALGADPTDFNLSTAYGYVRYQYQPDQPPGIIMMVQAALTSAAVRMRS